MNAFSAPEGPGAPKGPPGMQPLSGQDKPVKPFPSTQQQVSFKDPWEKMVHRGSPSASPEEVRKIAAKMKAQAMNYIIQDTKKRMDKLREDLKKQQREYGT